MKKNMGLIDKILRITVAVIIGVLYYLGIIGGTWGIVLIVLAVVFVVTGLVSFCPVYSLLGLNTCKRK